MRMEKRKKVMTMADRRMFCKSIIQSDQFCDLPFSAQALYFHLNLYADDDGFINNSNLIKRMIGASDEDIRNLIEKGYLITFESGVVVIAHWLQHNLIRADRYKETIYLDEKRHLIQQEDKKYRFVPHPEALEHFPVGIPDDNQLETQLSEEKENLEKNNAEYSSDEIMYQLGREVLTRSQYKQLIEQYGEKCVVSQIDKIVNHPYKGCLNEETIAQWCDEEKQRNDKTRKISSWTYEQNKYDFEELEKQLLDN